MKYSSALLFLLLCFNGAHAQVERGNFIVGGRGGIYIRNPDSHSSFPISHFQLDTEFCVQSFVTKRTSLGITTDFFYSNYESFFLTSQLRNFSLGPIIRHYVVLNRWAFFPELSFKFGRSKLTYAQPNEIIDKAKLMKVQAGIGLVYFITETVGLEMLFSRNFEQYNQSARKNINYNNLNFGLMVYLRDKSKGLPSL